MPRCLILLVTALLTGPGLAGAAGAQSAGAARPGTLRITVRDATDLPIAGARIAIAADGVDLASAAGGRVQISDSSGQALVEGLAPGLYSAIVDAPGFQPVEARNLSVRSGARTSREVVLQIAGIAEEIDVEPGDEDRGIFEAFTTQLTPDQIAALPEDPEELLLVLQQLAGSDADIRIDGFGGGDLPQGAQIQDVRIRWDDASADSQGGGPRIEIRTRPGGGRWRTSGSFNLRDERLNARNAFSGERPSGQTRQYGWTLNGPLVRNRTGVSLSIEGSEALEQQAVRAATPGGIFAGLVSQPATRLGATARIEHALNPSQTIRVEFRHNDNDARNQGIGEFDFPERGYTRERSDGRVRIGHNASWRRRFVNDLRFEAGWNATESIAASRAAAVRVLDAFASGGAQIQGGRRSKAFEIEDELEFTVRQKHRIEIGVSVSGSRSRGDEWRNAGGTFTFASLETFETGRPTTFTQRLGDPRFEYSTYRAGWNVQDNYRVRPNLMLSLGLRHDVQSHLSDWANVSPRASVNWTPVARWRTAIRASFGVFHQSFADSLYEQTILVDGARQRDLVIADPGYPDPFRGGLAQASRPPGIIRADPELTTPFTRRWSLGVDQPLARWGRLRATYARQTGHHLFRSRDVNAPIDGVRPDPSIRNLTRLESTARSLNHSVEVHLSANYRPRRFTGNLSYRWGQAYNETDGALTLPPDSFDLSGEWGPSRQDIRHRVNASVNTDLAAGFRLNAGFRVQSATPYTLTTGFDANGDGVNNERPAGVGRNSARGAATNVLDLTATWGIGLGLRGRGVDAAAARAQERGGRGSRDAGGGSANYVFRFEIFARTSNVLNLVNPQSFSGVLTSPFFGRPTSAAAARRVVLGTRVWF